MTQANSISSLSIRSIKIDPDIQQRRDMIDSVIVAEYTEAMRSGTPFPAVTVFYDGNTHWLADGFHRVEAADEAGLNTLAAVVYPGTRRDAILHAVGANRDHGLRRSRADIRRAIETLLGDADWVQWSNRMIADKVGCSDKTVAAVRNELDLNCGNSAVDFSPGPEPVIEEITEGDLVGIKTPWSQTQGMGKRIGRDGRARSAPKSKAKTASPFISNAKPMPKVNMAVVAMQRAHNLAVALDHLNEVLGDLLPEDARTVSSNLRRVLAKLEERFGREVTGDA